MKKILAVALAAAMILTTIVPTIAMAAVDYSYIRVRLDSMQHPSSVTFKLKGAYRIAEASGVDLYPNIAYTLKTDGTKQKLSYSNGAANVSVSLPATVTFVQYANGSSSNYFYLNNATYGWRYYSGNMTFRCVNASSGDYIEPVNTLFIENYLYGVVSCEMGNDWPAEALKAQSVCARTYAMAYVKSRQNGSLNYDVVDTTANQVYKGYPLESSSSALANVVSAVDATRGKVLLVSDPSGMVFADGMYSASNGGQVRTLTMRYPSGTNTYHMFKDDPYDLRNAASPKYVFFFPRSTAALSSLNATDLDKANAMIDLIKDKVVEALAAQGVACAKSAVTFNGVTNVTPTTLRSGVPEGSKEYTNVDVTVNVTLAGVTTSGLSVAYNGAPISYGSTTPTQANGTDFGSASVAGGLLQKTYTVANTGDAALTITGITVAGDQASDFTVGPAPTTIPAGQSGTFTVSFDPSAAGDRATTVSIASNDISGPYRFRVKGTGLSDGKSFTAFGISYNGTVYPGAISGTGITVRLPFGADITRLAAIFTADAGAAVSVASVQQTSGMTLNDFSFGPRTYLVTAQDGSAKAYNVTVTADLPASAPGANPDGTQAGGGGMPADATKDITVTLSYVSQASDGEWDVIGELRQKFAGYSTPLNSTNLWLLYASSDSNFFYVTARGYGHGVGMSQRGAQQMANEGKTYLDIVNFYYNTGTGKSTLETVSLNQRTLPQIPGKGSAAAYYKVNTAKLSLRAAASTKGTIIYTLTSGTIVEVTSTSNGWARVIYGSKGLVGYVASRYLKKTTEKPPSATATTTPSGSAAATPTPSGTAGQTLGKVVVASLYIRKSCSTTSEVVYDHLVKGDTVTILNLKPATNWYQVKFVTDKTYTGYAMCRSGSTTYIEVVGGTSSPTPTSTPTSGALSPSAVTAKANVSGSLTIRESAATTADKAGQIPANSSFTVLSVPATANWLKVKYSSTTGYVLAKYAVIGGNSAYRACTVTSSVLNVRSGAGTSYGVVGTLKSGDTALVTATVSTSSGSWYRIKVGTLTAYIDSRFARISTVS